MIWFWWLWKWIYSCCKHVKPGSTMNQATTVSNIRPVPSGPSNVTPQVWHCWSSCRCDLATKLVMASDFCSHFWRLDSAWRLDHDLKWCVELAQSSLGTLKPQVATHLQAICNYSLAACCLWDLGIIIVRCYPNTKRNTETGRDTRVVILDQELTPTNSLRQDRLLTAAHLVFPAVGSFHCPELRPERREWRRDCFSARLC